MFIILRRKPPHCRTVRGFIHSHPCLFPHIIFQTYYLQRIPMQKFTICVIGDDARQAYLAEYLEKEGMLVHTHADWNPAYLENCDLLIGPVGFYKNGELLPDVHKACEQYHVPILNYMSSREFLIANAQITAEGLLAYLILNTPFALNGANALILGFGRCGSAIANRLHVLGCRVDAYDLLPDRFEKPESYDLVINTIPAVVITLRRHPGQHGSQSRRLCHRRPGHRIPELNSL